MLINTTLSQAVQPTHYILSSDDEVKKIVEATKGTELEIPILLAAFCTMRRGEICGLSIDDIRNT